MADSKKAWKALEDKYLQDTKAAYGQEAHDFAKKYIDDFNMSGTRKKKKLKDYKEETY